MVATHSYILNKGISAILKEYRNYSIVEIIEELKLLETGIKSHQPDYLIISSEFLSQIDPLQMNALYKASPSTEFIQLKSDKNKSPHGNNHRYLEIYSNKTETSAFFAKCADKLEISIRDENRELTDREKDVLGCVAMGKTNKEIADELNISIHTAITHRKNITAKLGIKSISGLTVYAIFNGLISIDDVE